MTAGGLATAAVSAYVAVLYLACGGDTVSAPSPTTTLAVPSITPSAHPTEPALPNFLNGAEVIPLEIGPEIEFPEDTALIVATGCGPCDAPVDGLLRIYRDSSGALRVDDLLKVERFDLPPRLVETPDGMSERPLEVVGMAVNADGSEIFVGLCTRGDCVTIDPPSIDAQSTVFHSSDGGMTWKRVGLLPRVRYFAGIVNPGSVLVGAVEEGAPFLKFSVFPSGDVVEPPVSDRTVWPIVLDSGEILWNVEQRIVLHGDGSPYLDVSDIPGEDVSRVDVLGNSDGTRAIGLIQYHPEGRAVTYLIELTPGSPATALSTNGEVLAGVWTEEGTLFGHTSLEPGALPGHQTLPFRGLPAVIDVDNRSVQPITGPFLEEPFSKLGIGIVAAQRGPFARVVNTGSCLNIRESPNASARVRECVADGVLLQRPDPPSSVPPVVSTDGWLEVITPSDTQGWAGTQYLEY